MEEVLENKNCTIIYNPGYSYKTDCFGGRDWTDNANDPAFYSKTVRGHKKSWQAVRSMFNEKTTLEQVISTLRDNGIKCHCWCMVD